MSQNTYQTFFYHRSLKHVVFLIALMASASALAETPVDQANLQPINPYEAIKWKNAKQENFTDQNSAVNKSTYTRSGTVKFVDTRRAFKDERVLVIVGPKRNTDMVWLHSKNN